MSNLETGLHYPINLGELPASWEKGYVGDFALEIQPGFASGKHNKEGRGIPHIRPYNIDRLGKLDLSEIKSVDPDADSKRLHSGDVLFNNTNSPELIGKTAVIVGAGDWGFSNHMTRVAFPDTVSPKFAAYQLHYLWSRGYFLHNCVKHVNQASVSSTTLARAVPFVKPPRGEQDRIVAEIEKQFSRLDEAVASLKRAKANLKRYKASVLKAAVEGKMTEAWRKQHPKVEPAGKLLERILAERRAKWKGKGEYSEPEQPDIAGLPKLPDGWIWARLEAIAALKGGITVDKNRKSSGARKIPYLRVANVQRGYLDLSEVKEIDAPEADIKDLRLVPGDILFNEGGDRDKLGRGWVWEGQLSECIHQNHVFRARLYLADVSPKLVSCWGNSFGQTYFLREGKQTTNLASINITKLSAFPIPLPSTAEQQQIVAEVERRLSVIDELEATVETNLTRADRLRQSILSQAFSGRLRSQNSKDSPGAVATCSIAAESPASYGTDSREGR